MQIVIILRKILNTALPYKYVQWAYYNFSEQFQLIFDNSNVNNDKQIKQKMAN